jgi:hypothetical protein
VIYVLQTCAVHVLETGVKHFLQSSSTYIRSYRLHALMKFLCKTVTETLNDARLAAPRGATKILLDRLLATASAQGGIRNPTTNRAYRVQKTMFHDANVTTVNRVSTLFLLPHAIGHQAELFHEDDRDHVLCMIAQAQMMIIACRGHRSYTEDELRSVYEEGFIVFFRQVELLRGRAYERKFNYRMARHSKNPGNHARPKQYKRKSR